MSATAVQAAAALAQAKADKAALEKAKAAALAQAKANKAALEQAKAKNPQIWNAVIALAATGSATLSATATRADKLKSLFRDQCWSLMKAKTIRALINAETLLHVTSVSHFNENPESEKAKSIDALFRVMLKALVDAKDDGHLNYLELLREASADVPALAVDVLELAQARHHKRRAEHLLERIGKRQDHLVAVNDHAKRLKNDAGAAAPPPLVQCPTEDDEGEIIARLELEKAQAEEENDVLAAQVAAADVKLEAVKADVRRSVTMEVHKAIRDEYLRLGGNKVVLINAFAAAGKITNPDTFVQSAVAAEAESPEWYNPVHTKCHGNWCEAYTELNAKLVQKYQDQRDLNEAKGKGSKDYDTASRALIALKFVQTGDQVLYQTGGGKRRKRSSELFVVEMVKDVMAKLSGRNGEVPVSALYIRDKSRLPLGAAAAAASADTAARVAPVSP